MSEKQNKEHKITVLFLNLVLSMQTAALQNLGKAENPMTGKVEVNPEQARAYIDMLDMLEAKTQNNLNDDEKRYLGNALTELKTIYVEELKKKDK
ncbi:DUF1844 domain-containing protein [candidate division KSB1 bacterium]|nr:DUF1844 domain-containing protein [candidate division KSB1 bacterium]